MLPTEKQIISRMKKLLDFKSDKTTAFHTELISWCNSIINVLKIFLPSNSLQVRNLEEILKIYLSDNIYDVTKTTNLYTKFHGILLSTYNDYKKGFIIDLRSEIRAEVDTAFLSQAKRLLDEKLKDSAAMLIGAVLEDTLRQLCHKHGVKEGQNIESMNIPLRLADVYNLTVQKQVTAWAGIRNDADHARLKDYELNQVKLMHQGITDFIAKHLA